MSELSSEARALVSDGRTVLRPTSADRVRIASRLATRLGAAVMLAVEPSVAAPPAPLASKFFSVVAAVGLVGATAAYSLTSRPEARVAAPASFAPAPVQAAAPSPVTAPCAAPEADEVGSPADASAVPVSRKRPSGDGLSEEVALLSRATSQLRAGSAAAALELLDQHRRQFPAGHLVEERLSARVQALCSLGRRDEAQAELGRLARGAPRSPHVARAQKACGF